MELVRLLVLKTLVLMMFMKEKFRGSLDEIKEWRILSWRIEEIHKTEEKCYWREKLCLLFIMC